MNYNLIPRFNWDYGIFDYLAGLCAISRYPKVHGEIWQRHFGQEPVLTTSGRTSLYVILKSLNLPENAQVGVPLFCCPVVFDAVCHANLTLRFIDIDPDNYGICPEDLAKKKNDLSALVVVHMFGCPADMDAIHSVAGDLPVIEDCAQSLWSVYHQRRTGTLSTASFYSFRSGKYLSAGEGSAIFTSDNVLYSRIKDTADQLDDWTYQQQMTHCTSTWLKSTLYHRPWYGLIGYPIGRALDKKLNLSNKSGFSIKKIAPCDLTTIEKRLESFYPRIEKQRANALFMKEHVRISGAECLEEPHDCWSNYYQFVVRFKQMWQRDRVAEYLFCHGIDSAKYLDDVADVAETHYQYSGDCPNAEHCAKTILSIPHHYTMSEKKMAMIARRVNEAGQLLQKDKSQ